MDIKLQENSSITSSYPPKNRFWVLFDRKHNAWIPTKMFTTQRRNLYNIILVGWAMYLLATYTTGVRAQYNIMHCRENTCNALLVPKGSVLILIIAFWQIRELWEFHQMKYNIVFDEFRFIFFLFNFLKTNIH